MNNIFENIARENFRSSGYITHPSRERRIPWTFSTPPQIPFYKADTVRDALQRRERALHRENAKPTLFRSLLNAFLR
ncbi:hypothetical protein DDZ13_04605 [Coraliomargarita sinensis]|uniref:Uncharacterized protein n=1 Tax=Coraliomargarita sinensis TaxID=2174842 RepID=A0A317ZHQ3_9BACT|nr:hypothetical protein [Coraliomargarita sinensis]PXA05244.1 hypothetical protein DDZ13_04605 [Coraliomargarita sinensis]